MGVVKNQTGDAISILCSDDFHRSKGESMSFWKIRELSGVMKKYNLCKSVQ